MLGSRGLSMGYSIDAMFVPAKTEIMNHILDATWIFNSNTMISSVDKATIYKDEDGY